MADQLSISPKVALGEERRDASAMVGIARPVRAGWAKKAPGPLQPRTSDSPAFRLFRRTDLGLTWIEKSPHRPTRTEDTGWRSGRGSRRSDPSMCAACPTLISSPNVG